MIQVLTLRVAHGELGLLRLADLGLLGAKGLEVGLLSFQGSLFSIKGLIRV